MMPTYPDVVDVAELCLRWPRLAAAIGRHGSVTVEHVTVSHPEPGAVWRDGVPVRGDPEPRDAVHVATMALTYPAAMVEEEMDRRAPALPLPW